MKYKQSKNYLVIFLLLIVIFLAPLIVAILLYHKNPIWLHQKTVNKGYLISSNLNLHQIKLISSKSNSSTFTQSWFLFYLAKSSCHVPCQKNLHTLRQIVLALGKNSYRVKYGVILVNNKAVITQTGINKNSDLLIYRIPTPEFEKFFALLKMNKDSDAYYLVDPFGKIILYYSSDVLGEDIYQDLSRLLTISTTG